VLKASNRLSNDVAAFIDDSSITAAAGVAVSARDNGVISSYTLSLALSAGLAGVGVAVGSGADTISNDVSAYVDGATISALAGDIAVSATSTPTISTTSTTVAVSISIGVGVATFSATTAVHGATQAYVVDSLLTATGHDISITANSIEDIRPLVRGGAGSAVAVGVMSSDASIDGSTVARLTGRTTFSANNIRVWASDSSTATPETNLGSVGVVGVSVANSQARLNRRTEASIPGDARITLVTGSLSVDAQSDSTAYTSSRSDGGGGVAVTNLNIDSTVKSITWA
jgi:hypothetical protein